MTMKVKDVVRYIESQAPISYKESYDNVGLMVGDPEAELKGVLFSMDTTLAVIEEAARLGANLIVSHHPMLFIKPRSITPDTVLGRKIIELVRRDIHVYAAHTNLDVVKDGMNDTIVKMFQFQDSDILEQCEFDHDSGIGRVVHLRRPMTLEALIKRTVDVLKAKNIRFTGNLKQTFRRIAIINGSGQSYFKQAVAAGADCILTGDTTYHEVQELDEAGIAVVDPGHFHSEQLVYHHIMKGFAESLLEGADIPYFFSAVEQDPYQTWCKS